MPGAVATDVKTNLTCSEFKGVGGSKKMSEKCYHTCLFWKPYLSWFQNGLSDLLTPYRSDFMATWNWVLRAQKIAKCIENMQNNAKKSLKKNRTQRQMLQFFPKSQNN